MEEEIINKLLDFILKEEEFTNSEYDYYYWDMTEKAIRNFFKQYHPERLNPETPKGEAIV